VCVWADLIVGREQQFRRVEYPVSLPLSHYERATGFAATSTIDHATKRWGSNTYALADADAEKHSESERERSMQA
jgi:hypothetical protein